MSLLDPAYSLFAVVAAFLIGIVVGRITSSAKIVRSRPRVTMEPSAAAAKLSIETRREIETLLAAGRKIEAIRICRAELGLGLKQAKDTVDLIEQAAGRGARAPTVH